MKNIGRNHDEENSKEGSTTETAEEATRRYGEASISAQLRHLRKPQYGAFVVEKRQREAAEVLCGVEHGPVWEYRLSHAVRLAVVSATEPRNDDSPGTAVAVC